MKTAVSIIIVAIALIGMVSLLTREDAQRWQLLAVGAVAGMLVGGLRNGRRGALIGVATGLVFGLIAPILYIPFWLAFTLPPHPEFDL